MSSDTAQHICVCAPAIGYLKIGHVTILTKAESPGTLASEEFFPISVVTAPGCTEYTVIPVPETGTAQIERISLKLACSQ